MFAFCICFFVQLYSNFSSPETGPSRVTTIYGEIELEGLPLPTAAMSSRHGNYPTPTSSFTAAAAVSESNSNPKNTVKSSILSRSGRVSPAHANQIDDTLLTKDLSTTRRSISLRQSCPFGATNSVVQQEARISHRMEDDQEASSHDQSVSLAHDGEMRLSRSSIS